MNALEVPDPLARLHVERNDAVREQIAYVRLAQQNPSDPTLEHTLGNLHRVNLRVEPYDDGLALICSDNGIGMTKSIIKDHLLVSGSARRHDVLNLERERGPRFFWMKNLLGMQEISAARSSP